MRFLFLLAITIGIVATVLLLRAPETTKQTISPTPTVSYSPTPPAESTAVNLNGKSYRATWFTIDDLSQLTLIPNFTEKRTARSLIDNKKCKAVVNGGFYTKDNQPTGLFVADFKTLRNTIPNSLLNGYIFIDQNNTASIVSSPPEELVRLALQTGPILIRDEKVVKLAIQDDEFARRVVAGITKKGKIIFLLFYDPENTWSGPKLAEIPAILSKVAARLELRDALNLDGGSASAFIRGDLSLEELTSVGSFFCIK